MTSSTNLLLIAILLISILVLFLLQQPTKLVRWIEKKNYQYEVTFALYMLTPMEKFVFNSILFLTTSLLLIASTLYLPNHILTVARRTYYYCLGDAALFTSSRQAAETLYGTATRAGDAVLDAATGWAQTAYDALAAGNRTAAEVVGEVGKEVVTSASSAAAASAAGLVGR